MKSPCWLFVLLSALGTIGCEQHYPSLDVLDAGIAGDRLQLLVSSSITVVPTEGSTRQLDRHDFLVSVPLGAAGKDVRPAVADLGGGDPFSPDFLSSRSHYRLGAAPDRVVRVTETGEGVRDDVRVDVLAPPTNADGGEVPRWHVVQSWRTPAEPPATASGRFVAIADEMRIVNVATLQQTPVPELSQTLRTAWKSDRHIRGLTQGLNYAVLEEPSPDPKADDDLWRVLDQSGSVVTTFHRVQETRVLKAVDEVNGLDPNHPSGELLGFYWKPSVSLPKGYVFELSDAEGRVRRSITLPPHISSKSLGYLEARWAPDRHLVVFFDAGFGVAEEGAIAMRIWDYKTGEVREQLVNVRPTFRVVGGRFEPRASTSRRTPER